MAFPIRKKAYNLGAEFSSGEHTGNVVITYSSHTSLKGWWRLNTDVSTAGDVPDSSGNSKTGTFDVDPDERPSYVSNWTPSTNIQQNSNVFDENDAVNVGSGASWDAIIGSDTAGGSTQKMTISAWIYKASHGPSNQGRILDVGNLPRRLMFYTTDTGRLIVSTIWDGVVLRWETAEGVVPFLEWAHVAFTYDANSTLNDPKLYLNGAEVAVSEINGPPVGPWGGIGALSMWIGDSQSKSNGFGGNISDLAIWNSVLKASEIQALYNVKRYGSFDLTRDFNITGTTINPPFTGSYAVGLQGINISRFDLFGVSVAPKMGRNGKSTFLTSISDSTDIIDVSPDAKSFFDDSLRLPKPVTSIEAVASASVEVISDDIFKIVEVPRYRLSRQTIGIEAATDDSKMFEEMNSLDPLVYLSNPDAIAYPVVFGVESPIDPFSYAGAIEPFVIRKTIAGNSTFIGNHDDPEPTGIRGGVSSGQYQVSTRNHSMPSNNYYDVKAEEQYSVFEELAFTELNELTVEEMPLRLGMVSDALETSTPFTDRTSLQQAYNNVTNKEIREVLTATATRADVPNGYPSSDINSKACGFDYYKSRGIDSITYGGLLK